MKKRHALRRCNRNNKVIIRSELEAKMVLANRQHRDKGETGYKPCFGPWGVHYHLTASPSLTSDSRPGKINV